MPLCTLYLWICLSTLKVVQFTYMPLCTVYLWKCFATIPSKSRYTIYSRTSRIFTDVVTTYDVGYMWWVMNIFEKIYLMSLSMTNTKLCVELVWDRQETHDLVNLPPWYDWTIVKHGIKPQSIKICTFLNYFLDCIDSSWCCSFRYALLILVFTILPKVTLFINIDTWSFWIW